MLLQDISMLRQRRLFSAHRSVPRSLHVVFMTSADANRSTQTTQLFRNHSVGLFEYIQPGDEIVVSKLDHEANIASWVQLAKDRNANLKWYEPSDKKNPQLEPEVLRELLSSKTKLVAFTHTSNILGTINDIKAIAHEVHRIPGALLCVDAVAYAPHRAIDVKDLEVDFYSFSWCVA